MILRGKNIVLGVTGGIAAYKIPMLVRLLRKEGANVKCVITEETKRFVSPLVLDTLSGNRVESKLVENDQWIDHVHLGKWADAFVIAPLTANTMSKMVSGHCDNMLMATYMSCEAPVWVAPAMDLDMFKHPSTDENLRWLESNGINIIGPEAGELASGLVGKGRMTEPQDIFDALCEYFDIKGPLKGKKVLVTAGPTYEKIDPVRYIGNYSSGKMGFAIAEEALNKGAQVTLITGPTKLSCSSAIERIDVESAEQMLNACLESFKEADIAIKAAAVADYRPKVLADQKIKKSGDLTLELEKTTDILKTLGAQKKPFQTLVGFALETNNELEYAQKKLEKKNLDFIVLNSLKDEGAGFGVDTNKITIVDRNNKIDKFELKPKPEVAKIIIDKIIELKP
ncbi:MAG: bifunctional phosphopantothenoylcysteine decarboxylase/phosphopantothenate--cysteine ligase CoaBC [Flavobacteriales bacterium]|nr:bifunctional phosphopantothenoylcysteine decarboxylase/phosphopantothenate--cysteine ligase CoaBC [Flavobacteriales bacterium]